MWFVYLSIALQIFFGIHAVKTGRPFVWVLAIIFSSVLGYGASMFVCLAYVVIELMPEWWNSSKGRKLKGNIDNKIDPEKSLKAAQAACDKVDTVQNRLNLAREYMQLQRYAEAEALYARCLAGPHAEDPQILQDMATAEFGLQDYTATLATLDKLKAVHARFNNSDAHLLYARALEGSGQTQAAISEYSILSSNFPSPEPACRLARLYQIQGDPAKAKELYQAVIKRSHTAGQFYNETNKDWVALAKREVAN